MAKRILYYEEANFFGKDDPTGYRVWVGMFEGDVGLLTTEVVSYDESTGFIETLNTIYVPA